MLIIIEITGTANREELLKIIERVGKLEKEGFIKEIDETAIGELSEGYYFHYRLKKKNQLINK